MLLHLGHRDFGKRKDKATEKATLSSILNPPSLGLFENYFSAVSAAIVM